VERGSGRARRPVACDCGARRRSGRCPSGSGRRRRTARLSCGRYAGLALRRCGGGTAIGEGLRECCVRSAKCKHGERDYTPLRFRKWKTPRAHALTPMAWTPQRRRSSALASPPTRRAVTYSEFFSCPKVAHAPARNFKLAGTGAYRTNKRKRRSRTRRPGLPGPGRLPQGSHLAAFIASVHLCVDSIRGTPAATRPSGESHWPLSVSGTRWDVSDG
jgi:hypothetical protein